MLPNKRITRAERGLGWGQHCRGAGGGGGALQEVGGGEMRDMEGQVLITGRGCRQGEEDARASTGHRYMVQDGGARNSWERGAANGLLNYPSGPQLPLLSLFLSPSVAVSPALPHVSTWLQPASPLVCYPVPLPFPISSLMAAMELSQPVDLWAPVSLLGPAACAEPGATQAALLWGPLGFSNCLSGPRTPAGMQSCCGC